MDGSAKIAYVGARCLVGVLEAVADTHRDARSCRSFQGVVLSPPTTSISPSFKTASRNAAGGI